MAKFPKFSVKNLFILLLLIFITSIMNVVGRLIGGKTPFSSAEAQCWTAPAAGSGSGSGSGSVCEATDSGAACAGACGACGGCSY